MLAIKAESVFGALLSAEERKKDVKMRLQMRGRRRGGGGFQP